jgi:5-bromo-4-chloroindolyl phosphate hydrolysis protein
MKERISKLLSVKSIVTIVLTAVFAFLAATGKVSSDQYLTVFSVVIAFYFGTQHEKKNNTKEEQ